VTDDTSTTAQARRIEYFCRNASGSKVIFVSSASGYDSFRMYVGVIGQPMRPVTVFDVQRLRDGGTTYIFTPEGVFFAPSRIQPPAFGPSSDGSCRWPTRDTVEDVCGWPAPESFRVSAPLAAEESFVHLDPDDYVITEDVSADLVSVNTRASVQ